MPKQRVLEKPKKELLYEVIFITLFFYKQLRSQNVSWKPSTDVFQEGIRSSGNHGATRGLDAIGNLLLHEHIHAHADCRTYHIHQLPKRLGLKYLQQECFMEGVSCHYFSEVDKENVSPGHRYKVLTERAEKAGSETTLMGGNRYRNNNVEPSRGKDGEGKGFLGYKRSEVDPLYSTVQLSFLISIFLKFLTFITQSLFGYHD